jgi:4-aminobutyrate aminotransferase/(S)-3-amino-2-methylpropionate transaminase
MAFRLRATSAVRSIARPVALRRHYASQAYFPDEPAQPTVKTTIPGPESTKAIETLSKVFDTRSLNMMADYTKSHGN